TIEMPVEIDGSVDFLHDGVGARREPPTPRFVAHGISTKPLMTSSQAIFAKRRLAMVLAGGIAGVVVGLAGGYGVATLTRKAGGDTVCRPAVELAKKKTPFARGGVAAVNVAKKPFKMPPPAFPDTPLQPVTPHP